MVPPSVDSSDVKHSIKMTADRILVRPTDEIGERKSRAGILIPATANVDKRLVWAEVIAVGPTVRNVEENDRVLFAPDAGYEVETRFDGPSARTVAVEFEPDACVLDLNMPGMDGYELAERLRARSPGRPPVLATMTAYGDFGHVERADAAGFDLYFTKPAEPKELAEQLEALLMERRAAAAI